MTGSTLRCDLQDHFEHVCVLQLPVRVRLTNGTRLAGTADTLRVVQGLESLQLQSQRGIELVPLNEIATLSYPQAGQTRSTPEEHWPIVELNAS
ncbi:Rho-binding antiterminator [Reinekea blandensis]|uniref:Uncharacterized protein n=1 Tax=Reinekea blandensis MED297 TaxID=314283 RepID=A4BCS7_9GAMM|nr:Rho-binding antiterminator [Reinekea blandensis]EAR10009.1 hypothetical protein MED297_07971 [Reinekea sp. MED297] [Reinekea blandensis MED297]